MTPAQRGPEGAAMTLTLLIPNLISASRLLLAALLPVSPQQFWFWLVAASAASDLLDGYLARRWQVQTWQGGLLDAVTDKLFMLTAMLTFAGAGRFAHGWVLLLLSRDLTVAVVAAYAALNRSWHSFRNMGSRWPGKLATAVQLGFLGVAALWPPLVPLVLLPAIAASLWASLDYGRVFVAVLRRLER